VNKRAIAKSLNWFAKIWLSLSGIIIAIGLLRIFVEDGFWAMANVMSPLNVWNYLAVLITISPGIGALLLAEKLDK